MKKTLLFSALFALAFIIMAFEANVLSPTHGAGAPAGYCNDPAGGNKTCNTTGCHTGPTPASQTAWITSNIPGTGYIPGNTYTITATATRAGHSKFGFEISPQNSGGTFLGALINVNSDTQLTGTGNNYVTHTSTGTSGNGSKTWTFNWTAPAAGSGNVTFYGTFNITNSSNTALGDTIYTSTMLVSEGTSTTTTGLQNQKSDLVSLNIFPNPASDNIHVKCTISETCLVEIKLFDIQGKISDILYSSKTESGDKDFQFDIKGKYSPGVYFLKTCIDNKSDTKRIVIK